MTWLTWRLQRAEMLFLAAVALAISASLVISQSDVATRARLLTLQECIFPSPASSSTCNFSGGILYRLITTWIYTFNFLPLIVALLLALPIVTELENGTYRLAWTQSVTRRRWLWTKLGLLVVGGMGFAAILTLTFSWWSSPINKISGKLGQDWYDLGGILPFGYMLFALGLVMAIGVVFRRPIPAFALTTVLFVTARVVFIIWIRPHLKAPLTRAVNLGQPNDGWNISSYWVDASGNHLSFDQVRAICNPNQGVPNGIQVDCPAQHGLTMMERYHPASHYWPFQIMETGVFAAAGLALIAFAAWYILRRFE
jgi:hypothetical protein